MKKYYLLLAVVCLSGITRAQLTVSATASNSNICLGNSSSLTATAAPIGYTVTAITTNPSAAPGTNVLAHDGVVGTTLSSGSLDDGRWDNIALPFSFRFFGNIFTSINVSTNGWVGLGANNSTTTGYGFAIPSSNAPNNVIHAMTCDLTFGGGSSNIASLEYFTEGFPPNRKFIVNYADVKFLSSAGTGNVQVILYETTNVIEIHTTDCSNIAAFKTQGIENSTGTIASVAPGRNNIQDWSITPTSSSYRFTPDNITFSWSPAASLNTSTGGTVIARPTTNTTYTVTATNTVTSQTATNTVAVNINPSSYTLAGVAGGGQVCQNISVNASGTSYRDGSCQLIARLLPSGVSPLTNSVNTCMRIDSGATKRGTADLYLARKYDIEPILNASTATATVTLFYLQTEFDNYNRKALDSGHKTLPTGPSDAAGIAQLKLHQFHGVGTNPLDYSGSQEIFSTATSGFTVTWNATNGYWEVTVPVAGFSGFYITSDKLTAMPVKLIYFKGSLAGSANTLNWKVTCTSTEAKFTIERSTDARTYSSLSEITADQLRCEMPFEFTDALPLPGNNFYRVKMTDIDGKSTYTNTILLARKNSQFEIVSINPNIVTGAETRLKITAQKKTAVTIFITDNTGRRVYSTNEVLATGSNSIVIPTAFLAGGTYHLSVMMQGENVQTMKFIVK